MMPLIFTGIKAHTEPFLAWRWAMFVPAFMHIISGILILFFSTDLPDGNYAVLKKSGGMSKDNPMKVFWTACLNYRCARPTLLALLARPLFEDNPELCAPSFLSCDRFLTCWGTVQDVVPNHHLWLLLRC